MSEVDNNKPNDKPDSPQASEPKAPLRSNRRRVLAGLATITAVVLAGGNIQQNNWNDKLSKYELGEQQLIEQKRQKGSKCLGQLVVLRAGIVIRDTPQSINGKLPIIMKGNQAGTVGDGQELPVTAPLWYVDENKNSWVGFTQGMPIKDSPDVFVPSSEIAKNTVWANYSKLLNDKDQKGQPRLVRYDLPETESNTGLTQDCPISDNGQPINNTKVVAYSLPGFGEGQIESIIDLGVGKK